MKRIISCILVLVLSLALCACKTSPSAPANTDEPATEPAEQTAEPTAEAEAPTDEPSEAPTDEPANGADDFYALLEKDVPFTCDLDFDGADDEILVTEQATDEYGDFASTVKITRGGSKAEPYEFKVDYSYGVNVWVMDCDPEDSRLNIIVSYEQDSSDWTTAALRLNADGSDYDVFEYYCGVALPADYDYDHEQGFPGFESTDLFGTYFMDGYYTVGPDGIVSADNVFMYPVYEDPDIQPELMLERDLDVEIVDSETYEPTGESYTVPSGAAIRPFMTDLATYAVVRLEDGRLGRVSVSPANGEDQYGWFINGIHQDEYGQIPYAD